MLKTKMLIKIKFCIKKYLKQSKYGIVPQYDIIGKFCYIFTSVSILIEMNEIFQIMYDVQLTGVTVSGWSWRKELGDACISSLNVLQK